MTAPNRESKLADTAESAEPSSQGNDLDVRMSPRSSKGVVFAEPEAGMSPLMIGKNKEIAQSDYLDLDRSAKQFRASVSGKRLSGRPSLERLGSSSRTNIVGNPSVTSLLADDSESNTSAKEHHHHHHEHNLMKQVSAWLKHEKARRAARKAKRKEHTKDTPRDTAEEAPTDHSGEPITGGARRGSDSSQGSVALEQLANILERTLSLKSNEGSPRARRASYSRKLSSIMKRSSTVSSDTDYFEGAGELVPSCDAILDNSKTMAYGGGVADPPVDSGSSVKSTSSRRARKEKEAWNVFKYEIVRITHTLKLKGWRRVPLDQSSEIEVQRLSGALTNAVYVVSPPKDIRPQESERKHTLPAPKNPPPKLLLRIYGPNVEHLIDRESELQILKRLARKHIGPRLLGTFTNGRFEEFFHAKTLTSKDLRIPDTSKQIAKRLRELHEGVDLLQEERNAGPFVWQNWDKWVDRCEQVVTWLDKEILENQEAAASSAPNNWRRRGLVCGVQWPLFRRTIEKYRSWLEEQYGGLHKINERLVFSHNDTQYGNILRLIPAGESPLLLPANEHKQLVVIDFEYANANLPGLEFANHFTEWCYNYHAEPSYSCAQNYYPNSEEQRRFIRSYLLHNPMYRAPMGSASNPPTPHLGPLLSSSSTAAAATANPSSISAFMLDSRAPPGERSTYEEREAAVEAQVEEETKRLMAETKLWRLANSALWIAWGIVQAHIPDMPDFDNTEQDEAEEKLGKLGPSTCGKGDEGKEKPSTCGKGDEDLDTATKPSTCGKGNEAEARAELDNAILEMKVEAKSQEQVEEGELQGEEEEEEFDYLAYAQERAMFAWGDAIQLGIVKADDLPESLKKAIKWVEY